MASYRGTILIERYVDHFVEADTLEEARAKIEEIADAEGDYVSNVELNTGKGEPA